MKHRLVQITAGAAPGDAITNYVRYLDSGLGRMSLFRSTRIYAENIADVRPGPIRHVCTYTPGTRDVLIYHHSVGFRHLPGILFPGVRPLLVYHNITPSRFYAPWNFRAAGRMELGRRQLSQLAGVCAGAVALSEFSAGELLEAGFRSVEVLPYPVEASMLRRSTSSRDSHADSFSVNRSTSPFRIVFVGRMAPNKRIELLLDVFAVLRKRMREKGRDVQLILAGSLTGDRYADFIRGRCVDLGVAEDVVWTGYVDDVSLSKIWEGASLYLSLSEHEGFGVPLLEAMGHNIPVLALCAPGSSVAEVLGGAGVGFRDVSIEWVADSAYRMLTDPVLRELVIEGQRKRFEELRSVDVAGRIRSILEGMIHDR